MFRTVGKSHHAKQFFGCIEGICTTTPCDEGSNHDILYSREFW